MRPKLLKMTAFGPYAGEQVIDFTKLEDANMFLIYGPTGGGKTTILDAICYALYGETNGGERSGENMRSKFATEDTITEVELFFNLRNDEYRIIRRPQYERVAKRGGTGKMVKVASEVELYKKEEDTYKLLTAKYNEVGEKITEILHFNVGQFRQVIMIAQNKFRELLTVSSKERQQILQDLFQTGIYQDVEKALELIYNASKDSFKEKQLLYENYLSNIEASEEDVINDYLKTKVIHNAPEVCTRIEALCKFKAEEEEEIKQNLLSLDEKLSKSQALLMKLNKQNEEVEEKKRCQVEWQGLEEKREFYNELADKTQKAEKTLPIVPIEEIVMELKEQFITQKAQTTAYEEKLKKIDEQLAVQTEAMKQQEKVPEEVEALKKQFSIYETYQPRVMQLEQKEEEKVKMSNKLKKAEDRYIELVKKVEALKLNIVESENRLKEKDKLATCLNECVIKQKEVAEVLKQKREREVKKQEGQKVLNKLDEKQNEINRQESLFKSYDEEYRVSFKRWFMNQAGEIAQSLEEDKPCPVCGSLVHPHKAILTSDHLTKEELDALEVRNKEEESKLAKLKEERSALEKECKLVKERLEEFDQLLSGKEEVTEELAKVLLEKYQDLDTQIQQLTKLQKQVEDDKEQLEKEEKNKEIGANFISEQKQALSEVTAYITSVQNEVPKELLVKGALEEKLKAIELEYKAKEGAYKALVEELEALQLQRTQMTTALNEGEKRVQSLNKQGIEKKKQLELALEAAGFTGLAEYKAYKMTPNALQEAKESLTIYSQRKAILAQKLDELEKKTKDFNKEELEAAKLNHEALMSELKNSNIKQDEAQKYQIKHLKLKEQIEKLYEEVKLMVKKQEVIEKISLLAKGKNKKGLSFERYIQSSIFEEVLRSANKKLSPMTHSRYELYRSNDLSRANAQAGLDIGIKDYYNNETRPVNTLSGGESFMAALALALGLSEVIQRLAGATPLDTLFIDEGFGSLDEEALELAIKTLLNIQDTGRLIGIISHVKELREQIPIGLEITTGAKGSFATFKL